MIFQKERKMSAESISTEQDEKKAKMMVKGGSSDSVYGLGLIGAWIYYIGGATTTEEKVKGFFKGLVWPVFVVRDLLKFLNKE
jgi:hypothetical protein